MVRAQPHYSTPRKRKENKSYEHTPQQAEFVCARICFIYVFVELLGFVLCMYELGFVLCMYELVFILTQDGSCEDSSPVFFPRKYENIETPPRSSSLPRNYTFTALRPQLYCHCIALPPIVQKMLVLF
jgi:hypothetical protein